MRYNIIDTVHIILNRSKCGELKHTWNINEISSCLDKYYIATNNKTGKQHIVGHYANFRVFINNEYVEIKGSLPKYYYGNNIKTLTYEDAILAIESIAFDFNLPLERGYIKRIDLGRNLIVRRQVNKYLDAFDNTNGFYRDRTTNRLLYKTPNKQLALNLYDKKKEIKRNDKELFEYLQEGSLKNKNILRYEVQITQRANMQLGYKSLRVVHLRSKTFLKIMNDNWFNNYNKLLTQKKFKFSADITSYEELKNQILIYAIEKFGLANLLDLLEDLRKDGKFTSSQKRYAKVKINELMKTNGLLIELDHIEELNKQMEFLHQNLSNNDYDLLNSMITNHKKSNFLT